MAAKENLAKQKGEEPGVSPLAVQGLSLVRHAWYLTGPPTSGRHSVRLQCTLPSWQLRIRCACLSVAASLNSTEKVVYTHDNTCHTVCRDIRLCWQRLFCRKLSGCKAARRSGGCINLRQHLLQFLLADNLRILGVAGIPPGIANYLMNQILLLHSAGPPTADAVLGSTCQARCQIAEAIHL